MKKFPVILLIFLFVKIQLAFSQDVDIEIKKADSLFKTKRYTQAFQLYEKLFEEKEIYTPQMLIKMSFIQEGLDNYPKALFYLNQYYLLTNDKLALEKMEELADKHQLKGYEYSDFKFIYNLVRFYKDQITFVFVIFIAIMIVWIVYTKHKKRMVLKVPALFTLGILCFFLMVNLFLSFYSPAIVTKNTFMMSGPSAGADVVEVMKAGNKITVVDDEDVWLKIAVDDRQGYIKKTNVHLLN